MNDVPLAITREPAVLALADGSIFSGISIGAPGETVGEVVFNTAMTGYQEILTDPSYAKQIVTLTYPHIGNVGVNSEDQESGRVQAAGLVIRDLSMVVSNWRAQEALPTYLARHNIVAIAEIDTRRLTRLLREKGAQNGCIMTGQVDPAVAVAKAREFAGLEGMDLARVVTCSEPSVCEFEYNSCYPESSSCHPERSEGSHQLGTSPHIIAYDFGVKQNILNLLIKNGCRVTKVPAQTTAETVLAMEPDGVFLSNGPGDPAACDYAIANAKCFLEEGLPLFGICLGCQIMALAAGAKTFKMKFGHHGANHPVQDLRSGVVMITSQNHGFAIDESTLPAEFNVTHRSLFDKTIQGIRHQSKPAFAFQGHPEASPGPHDIEGLFREFVAEVKACQKEPI